MNFFRSGLSACVIMGLPNVTDYIHKHRDKLMEEKRQKLIALENQRHQHQLNFNNDNIFSNPQILTLAHINTHDNNNNALWIYLFDNFFFTFFDKTLYFLRTVFFLNKCLFIKKTIFALFNNKFKMNLMNFEFSLDDLKNKCLFFR